MNVKFKYTEAAKVDPIRIEQVFAEKPGGGIVSNSPFEVAPTTAVGESGSQYTVIKAYRLVGTVAAADTAIKVEKGSGVTVGDVIAHGKKGVACTAVDTTPEDHDLITVTLGVAIPVDTVLYQAKEASADAAEPICQPKYVTGNRIPANVGDFPVRLINGANLRKETACVADEVVALLPLITLV